jgi:hypothetical protein
MKTAFIQEQMMLDAKSKILQRGDFLLAAEIAKLDCCNQFRIKFSVAAGDSRFQSVRIPGRMGCEIG